jgi:hypothetical protein
LAYSSLSHVFSNYSLEQHVDNEEGKDEFIQEECAIDLTPPLFDGGGYVRIGISWSKSVAVQPLAGLSIDHLSLRTLIEVKAHEGTISDW